MTSLIAMLSSGKGAWAHVSKLISIGNFDKIFLICNDYSFENYKTDKKNVFKLRIDEKNPKNSLDTLSKLFRTEIKDFEVALNLYSGTGIEHMALMSAVLKAGLGLRFIYADFDKLEEFKLSNEEFINDNEDMF